MNKKMIVYFTYTNNTKLIANKIKDKLNCDILELKPVNPYSSDYQKVVDEEEKNNNCLREIQDINIDLKEYDTIILGTPVWWYTITPVVRTFLTKYNLKGKTIVPFATNAGWLGNTFKEIKELCKDSNVKNEADIVFESYSDKLKTSEEYINNWIDNI